MILGLIIAVGLLSIIIGTFAASAVLILSSQLSQDYGPYEEPLTTQEKDE